MEKNDQYVKLIQAIQHHHAFAGLPELPSAWGTKFSNITGALPEFPSIRRTSFAISTILDPKFTLSRPSLSDTPLKFQQKCRQATPLQFLRQRCQNSRHKGQYQ
uniref:Uncharacterized protein n=1 Tax=Arundo donax TaxID=35708 RepID=A0A0A9GU18_ARUDO